MKKTRYLMKKIFPILGAAAALAAALPLTACADYPLDAYLVHPVSDVIASCVSEQLLSGAALDEEKLLAAGVKTIQREALDAQLGDAASVIPEDKSCLSAAPNGTLVIYALGGQGTIESVAVKTSGDVVLVEGHVEEVSVSYNVIIHEVVSYHFRPEGSGYAFVTRANFLVAYIQKVYGVDAPVTPGYQPDFVSEYYTATQFGPYPDDAAAHDGVSEDIRLNAFTLTDSGKALIDIPLRREG